MDARVSHGVQCLSVTYVDGGEALELFLGSIIGWSIVSFVCLSLSNNSRATVVQVNVLHLQNSTQSTTAISISVLITLESDFSRMVSCLWLFMNETSRPCSNCFSQEAMSRGPRAGFSS